MESLSSRSKAHAGPANGVTLNSRCVCVGGGGGVMSEWVGGGLL